MSRVRAQQARRRVAGKGCARRRSTARNSRPGWACLGVVPMGTVRRCMAGGNPRASPGIAPFPNARSSSNLARTETGPPSIGRRLDKSGETASGRRYRRLPTRPHQAPRPRTNGRDVRRLAAHAVAERFGELHDLDKRSAGLRYPLERNRSSSMQEILGEESAAVVDLEQLGMVVEAMTMVLDGTGNWLESYAEAAG